MLEATYATARLIQTFPRLELPEGEPNIEVGKERQTLTLVIASADGCFVKLGRD